MTRTEALLAVAGDLDPAQVEQADGAPRLARFRLPGWDEGDDASTPTNAG